VTAPGAETGADSDSESGGNVQSPTPGAETAAGVDTASETAPALHHDDDAPALDVVAAAPELLADSLGEYVKAWVKRIRNGESGALPIILGLVLIVIIFQVQQSRFLSAGNIVNLLVQAAFFVTLGLGEIFVLILSEIDLSTGFVAASAPPSPWPSSPLPMAGPGGRP